MNFKKRESTWNLEGKGGGNRKEFGEDAMVGGVSGLDPNTLYAWLLNKIFNKNKTAVRKQSI